MIEAPPVRAPVSDLTFEQALAELEKIVGELESGQAPLERAIEMYERGAELKSQCELRLKSAQLRVDRIMVGPDGEALRAEPADFS